jgi:hypothetical protein
MRNLSLGETLILANPKNEYLALMKKWEHYKTPYTSYSDDAIARSVKSGNSALIKEHEYRQDRVKMKKLAQQLDDEAKK